MAMLAGVPQVMSRSGFRAAAAGLDQGAVEADERPPGLPPGGQDLVQVGAWAAITPMASCRYRYPVAWLILASRANRWMSVPSTSQRSTSTAMVQDGPAGRGPLARTGVDSLAVRLGPPRHAGDGFDRDLEGGTIRQHVGSWPEEGTWSKPTLDPKTPRRTRCALPKASYRRLAGKGSEPLWNTQEIRRTWGPSYQRFTRFYCVD